MRCSVPTIFLGAAFFAPSCNPITAQPAERIAGGARSIAGSSRPLASGGATDAAALELLAHPEAETRRTGLRLLGDRYSPASDRQGGAVTKPLVPATQEKLLHLARVEREPAVRAELARLARWLPAVNALPILGELFARIEDVDNQEIALLEWSAWENKLVGDRAAVLDTLKNSAVWRSPIFSKFIVLRMARRCAAEPTDENQDTLAWFIEMAPGHEIAPGREFVDELVDGMEAGLQDQYIARITPALKQEVSAVWAARPHTVALIIVALRLNHPPGAKAAAAAALGDPKTSDARRSALREAISHPRGASSKMGDSVK